MVVLKEGGFYNIMKKNVFSLGMMLMLIASLLVGCGSKEAETETESDSGFQYVSIKDAEKAAKEASVHILDVREWDNYKEGRLPNSEWVPIFPLEDDGLADDMEAYAKANLEDDKDIYIVCNSGQRGAEKSTDVLIGAGIDEERIYTVEGGAKALGNALTTNRADDSIDWQYIDSSEVLNLGADAQIVDVRDDENWDNGHLEGSIHQNLTDIEDAGAQEAMFQLAEKELDKDKPVYFLCYSGNKCAKTAISVLKDGGYDVNELFIIKDGAKDKAIEEAFIK